MWKGDVYESLTSHEVKFLPLLIRPVQPQDLDMMCKCWICLDTIEDVEPSVEIFSDIVLVFAKVEVKSAEDDAHGNVSVEC